MFRKEMIKMNKFEKKVIGVMGDDFKAPYEVAELLRLKRKVQLIKLKDTLNKMYSNDIINMVAVNGEKKIYVKKM